MFFFADNNNLKFKENENVFISITRHSRCFSWSIGSHDLGFGFVALIGGMASCTFDDTDLQNSIDDLTSRVEALENFQEQVQGDIASLQDIISKLRSCLNLFIINCKSVG